MESRWAITNPFTAGQKVTIPVGTVIRTTRPNRDTLVDTPVAKKTYTVTIHHLFSGWIDALGDRGPRGTSILPQITWAGSGGYWNDVQVTPELLAANGLAPLTAPALTDKDLELLKVTPDPNGPHTDRWAVPAHA